VGQAQLQATILASRPIAYWPMQETSGTVAHDVSGFGHNGTYVGGCVLNQGGPQTGVKAVSFDGSTGYVNAGLLAASTGVNQLSAECYVNVATDIQDFGAMFSQMDSGNVDGFQECIRSSLSSDTEVFTAARDGQMSSGQTTTPPYTLAVWHQIVMVYDGTQATDALKLMTYVDGVPFVQQFFNPPIPPTMGVSDNPLTIAAAVNNGVASLFAHVLGCNFALYNYPLTQAQIKNHLFALSVMAKGNANRNWFIRDDI
jgi:hypothetical protein